MAASHFSSVADTRHLGVASGIAKGSSYGFVDADDAAFSMEIGQSSDGREGSRISNSGVGFYLNAALVGTSPHRTVGPSDTAGGAMRRVYSLDRLKDAFQDADYDSYAGCGEEDVLRLLEDVASDDDDVKHTQARTKSFLSSAPMSNAGWILTEGEEESILRMIVNREAAGRAGGNGAAITAANFTKEDPLLCCVDNASEGANDKSGKGESREPCIGRTSTAATSLPPPPYAVLKNSASSALLSDNSNKFVTLPADHAAAHTSLVPGPIFIPSSEGEGEQGGEDLHGLKHMMGNPLLREENGENARPTFSVSAMDSRPSSNAQPLPPPPLSPPGHISASTGVLLPTSDGSSALMHNTPNVLSPSLSAMYNLQVPLFTDSASGGLAGSGSGNSSVVLGSMDPAHTALHHPNHPPPQYATRHGGLLYNGSGMPLTPSGGLSSGTLSGAGGASTTSGVGATAGYMISPMGMIGMGTTGGQVSGNAGLHPYYSPIGVGNSPTLLPSSPLFSVGNSTSSTVGNNSGKAVGMAPVRRSKPPPPAYEEVAAVSTTPSAMHSRSPEVSPLSGLPPPFYAAGLPLPPPPPPPPPPPQSFSIPSSSAAVVGGGVITGGTAAAQQDTLLVRNQYGVFLLQPTTLKIAPLYTPPVMGSSTRGAAAGTGRSTPPSPLAQYSLPPSASAGMGGRYSHFSLPPPPPPSLPPSALDPTAAAFISRSTSGSGAGGPHPPSPTLGVTANTSFAPSGATTPSGPFFLSSSASVGGGSMEFGSFSGTIAAGGAGSVGSIGANSLRHFTPANSQSITVTSFPPPYLGAPSPDDLTAPLQNM